MRMSNATAPVLPFVADHAQRVAAVGPRESFLVQAPAGSGKTTLLTERFLRLLSTVESPDQVLAITFTRAAKAEMESRVLKALAEASGGVPANDPAKERILEAAEQALQYAESRGWDLLADPGQLNIQTIDSLAFELARQKPVTSRLGPGLAPVEDSKPFYRRAALRALQCLEDLSSTDAVRRQAAEAAATLLRHRDNKLQHCTDLIAQMLEQRDQWRRLFPLGSEQLSNEVLDSRVKPELERMLRVGVEADLRTLRERMQRRPDICRDILELARSAAPNATNEIQSCRDLPELPLASAEHIEFWHGIACLLLKKDGQLRKQFKDCDGLFAKDNRDMASELSRRFCEDEQAREALHAVRSLPPHSLSDDEWKLAKAIFRLLAKAVLELKLIFAANGMVDFVEVSLAAIDALQDGLGPSDAALSLGYRHLLVDEFQDTSLTHHELLALLIQGWEAGDGRTVFLVGDPMQSIYLFRQAEVRLFKKVRQLGFGQIEMKYLPLTVNFRSQSALIEEHNLIFQTVFAEQDEVEFVASRSFHKASASPAVQWHFWLKQKEDKAGLEFEAEQICELVRESLERDKEKKETVAILVRAKHHGIQIMRSLREANIPYRATGMETLAERQEVLDIFTLARAVLNPADRVAWLSVLRAPWCGLGMAELDTLVGDQKYATMTELIASRSQLLDNSSRARVERVAAVLGRAASAQGSKQFPALLWQAWRETGGDACVNEEQYGNILAFFAMLERMDAEGLAFHADEIKDAMTRLFASPNPAPGIRVEVCSIHKAKGREFDTVIIPQMHRKGGRAELQALDWIEESGEDAAFYIAPINETGAKSSLLGQWIRKKRHHRERMELRRLLYVAATRAKRQVHFFAELGLSKDDGIKKPNADSLLAVAWTVARPEAERYLAELAEEPAEELLTLAAGGDDERQRIRRLPDAWIAAHASGKQKLRTDSRNLDKHAANDSWIMANRDIRTSGTMLHGLLEQAARKRARGDGWEQLQSWAAGAQKLVQTGLLTAGMPSSRVNKVAVRIRELLRQALGSKVGQWVLEDHPESHSEYAVTHWQSGEPISVRLDRVFAAGAAPLSSGETDLWIIDYKSAAMGGAEVKLFLETQAAAYEETMASYARCVNAAWGRGRPIHYALYFPALDRIHELGKLN